MSDVAPSVIRPDGRTYQPLKPPAAVMFQDIDRDQEGVLVLRTHDVDLATQLALDEIRRHGYTDVYDAHRTWIRQGIRNGERCYEHDQRRGAAAVMFTIYG